MCHVKWVKTIIKTVWVKCDKAYGCKISMQYLYDNVCQCMPMRIHVCRTVSVVYLQHRGDLCLGRVEAERPQHGAELLLVSETKFGFSLVYVINAYIGNNVDSSFD